MANDDGDDDDLLSCNCVETQQRDMAKGEEERSQCPHLASTVSDLLDMWQDWPTSEMHDNTRGERCLLQEKGHRVPR